LEIVFWFHEKNTGSEPTDLGSNPASTPSTSLSLTFLVYKMGKMLCELRALIRTKRVHI
jgi:hypothetical protein